MPSVVDEVLRLHRAQLQGLIELRGVRRMRKLYETARGDLESRLAGLRRTNRDQTFSAHHLRLMLIQVKDGLTEFERVFARHLSREGAMAAALGQRHLISAAKKLERRFTGHTPVLRVEQAAVLRGVYDGVMPSLLDRHETSVRRYTRPVVEKIKLEMAQSIVQGEAVDRAVDRVVNTDGVFAAQRWRAERIVRTEMSFEHNVVKYRTMQTMYREDMPDLQRKLIETFDDRTGDDSKLLHGQIRAMGEPFVYTPPPGKTGYPPFLMPPGRPNDRAVVIPWRPGWAESAVTQAGEDGPGAVDPSVPPLTQLTAP